MIKAELINFLKPFANDIQILVDIPKEGFNISKVSYLQVGPVKNNDNEIVYVKAIFPSNSEGAIIISKF